MMSAPVARTGAVSTPAMRIGTAGNRAQGAVTQTAQLPCTAS